MNVMLVDKLAALLPQSVVPLGVNPGFSVSGLSRGAKGERAERFKKMVADYHAYTSEQGSRHVVYAAHGGKNEEVRGAFVSFKLEVQELPDWMLNEEGKTARDKIWVCATIFMQSR
jgi:hypothetical protein